MSEQICAELILTGNELLDGSIADQHVQALTSIFSEYGHRIVRAQIVSDDPDELLMAFQTAKSRSAQIFVTGGLGPTTDDRSLELAARAMGSKLYRSPEAETNVREALARMGRKALNPGHEKMMLVPTGARALSNKAGTAPAVFWEVDDKEFFFLPGPPNEFHQIVEDHVRPWLKNKSAKQSHLFIFKVFGRPESELSLLMERAPVDKDITIGFRTVLPENHIKALVPAENREAAYSRLKNLREFLYQALGKSLFTEEDKSFEEVIVQSLGVKGLKVALAESCTGGLACHMLTKVSGSSSVVDRGFVTYSNEAKIEMLGVQASSLETFGAVSEEVAQEMAVGALKNSKADIAVSITGIAGPGGGSEHKPVGTVCFAKASDQAVESKKLHFPFDRHRNQAFAAYTALQCLVE